MKKQVIFAIIITGLLMNIGLAFGAGQISINYPDTINSGEEFNVNLNIYNFSEDSYDVKIDFITNNSKTSEIWNGNEWQTTYNYVNGAINSSMNNEGIFRLNLTSCYNQTGEIIVKLRDSKDKVYTFNNYSINVVGNCNVNNPPIDDDNQTSNEGGDGDNTNNNDISLNLDWSGDMKNGKDFEVKIEANNLEDKTYDVKIYIYDDDKNKPISQVCDNSKWISSTSYISEFFKGPGDKSKTVKLRIKDSSKDFNGEATIGIRMREHGKTIYMKEMEASIDILKVDSASSTSSDAEDSGVDDNSNKSINQAKENIDEVPTTEEVIHLGSSKIESESIKSKKNIVYESKNESVKIYSIYSFSVLLVIFLGVLIFLIFKKQ